MSCPAIAGHPVLYLILVLFYLSSNSFAPPPIPDDFTLAKYTPVATDLLS